MLTWGGHGGVRAKCQIEIINMHASLCQDLCKSSVELGRVGLRNQCPGFAGGDGAGEVEVLFVSGPAQSFGTLARFIQKFTKMRRHVDAHKVSGFSPGGPEAAEVSPD